MLIVDTHVWLWALEAPERLPADVRGVMAGTRSTLLVSAVSMWEIALKVQAGKLAIQLPARMVLDVVVEAGAAVLPITMDHVLHELSDPPETRDPFDRLLLAQCAVEGARLLTLDRVLADHRLAWRPAP